jgi:hypothetical protein
MPNLFRICAAIEKLDSRGKKEFLKGKITNYTLV